MAGMGFEQLQSSERTERTPGPSERLTFFTLLYLVADIYISEINLHDPTVPTVPTFEAIYLISPCLIKYTLHLQD